METKFKIAQSVKVLKSSNSVNWLGVITKLRSQYPFIVWLFNTLRFPTSLEMTVSLNIFLCLSLNHLLCYLFIHLPFNREFHFFQWVKGALCKMRKRPFFHYRINLSAMLHCFSGSNKIMKKEAL